MPDGFPVVLGPFEGRGDEPFGDVPFAMWQLLSIYPHRTIRVGTRRNTKAFGTFWDMQTALLQKEIKSLLKAMGWSQNQAAMCVYYEENEDGAEDEAELRRYEESFRKCLNRPKTPPEYLEKVLAILSDLREAKRLGEVAPVFVPGPALSDDVRQKMREISRTISIAIKKK